MKLVSATLKAWFFKVPIFRKSYYARNPILMRLTIAQSARKVLAVVILPSQFMSNLIDSMKLKYVSSQDRRVKPERSYQR